MFPVELLARNDDLSGLIGFCIFAAFVVFAILAKAISSVSPEAMARKIREMQGQRGAERIPVAKALPATWDEPVVAQLVSESLDPAPKKKQKKKVARPEPDEVPRRLVADVRPKASAPAPVSAETTTDFRQAVIMAELLAPPLSLRHGRAGLLRSAPWIR